MTMSNARETCKEIEIGGVTQRFCWISPGRFLMGSPADEPERSANEVQHRVTLTKGFWLADTACTQELWQAVMWENPSAFKNNTHNPVENVSWYDVQQFISLLNRLVPGLSARLPTEAEWEYACRAGTTTPFSFSDELTPERVNYYGHQYPYKGGERGEYRGTTVPVKTFPANAWSLYEMHGNVLEWCADGWRRYDGAECENPRGPEGERDSRVVRGGSFTSTGGYVRSAHRYWSWPDSRTLIIGFRLAADVEG